MRFILIGPLARRRGDEVVQPNGMTLAFELFVKAAREAGQKPIVINIDWRRDTRYAWLSRIRRAAGWPLQAIVASLRARNTVYITISQSAQGFMRDAFFIWFFAIQGRQVVAHLHGGNYKNFYMSQHAVLQMFVRRTLRRLTAIIVLSRRLENMFDFDPSLLTKVVAVPNGCPELTPPGTAKSLLATNGPVRILFMSTMSKSKGFQLVLQAVGDLIDQGYRIKADFAGDFVSLDESQDNQSSSEQRRSFEQFIRRSGLDESVTYHGAVSGARKEKLLRQAHFFVLPTSYVNEGQPLSIIEAMSAGCVVISNKYRSIPDLVEDGRTGSLLANPTAQCVAKALRGYIDEPQRFSDASCEALSRYRRQFSLELHCQSILRILRSPASEHLRTQTGESRPA